MTQEQAAAALEVNASTLGSWENGASEPKLSQLNEIATLYGSNLDELIDLVLQLQSSILRDDSSR